MLNKILAALQGGNKAEAAKLIEAELSKDESAPQESNASAVNEAPESEHKGFQGIGDENGVIAGEDLAARLR